MLPLCALSPVDEPCYALEPRCVLSWAACSPDVVQLPCSRHSVGEACYALEPRCVPSWPACFPDVVQLLCLRYSAVEAHWSVLAPHPVPLLPDEPQCLAAEPCSPSPPLLAGQELYRELQRPLRLPRRDR